MTSTQPSSVKKTLKVGFDLDGVLLFNPLSATRPILKFIRHNLLKKENAGSFIPKSRMEKFTNIIYINSSVFISSGIKQLNVLTEKKIIEAYIITARHSTLKNNYEKSINRLNGKTHFTGCFYNCDDLEPYEFKKQMIHKLGLDVYIDDNWDVVQKLHKQTKADVFWVSNFLDSSIPYENKFYSLSEALKKLESSFL